MIPMNFLNAALRKNEILQEVAGNSGRTIKDTIMSHTLHLRDLSKRFGSTVALHPLTLSFPGGRFTSILGPSGCGKSTLLRLITGLERPSGGQIFVDDTEITDIPPVRRKIGMVFQQYALFPNLTVAEKRSLRSPWEGCVRRAPLAHRGPTGAHA